MTVEPAEVTALMKVLVARIGLTCDEKYATKAREQLAIDCYTHFDGKSYEELGNMGGALLLRMQRSAYVSMLASALDDTSTQDDVEKFMNAIQETFPYNHMPKHVIRPIRSEARNLFKSVRGMKDKQAFYTARAAASTVLYCIWQQLVARQILKSYPVGVIQGKNPAAVILDGRLGELAYTPDLIEAKLKSLFDPGT